jgi:hypothetical protein
MKSFAFVHLIPYRTPCTIWPSTEPKYVQLMNSLWHREDVRSDLAMPWAIDSAPSCAQCASLVPPRAEEHEEPSAFVHLPGGLWSIRNVTWLCAARSAFSVSRGRRNLAFYMKQRRECFDKGFRP